MAPLQRRIRPDLPEPDTFQIPNQPGEFGELLPFEYERGRAALMRPGDVAAVACAGHDHHGEVLRGPSYSFECFAPLPPGVRTGARLTALFPDS